MEGAFRDGLLARGRKTSPEGTWEGEFEASELVRGTFRAADGSVYQLE